MIENCIHDLNPFWCAICKGLKTPDEEQAELEGDWNLVDTSNIPAHDSADR